MTATPAAADANCGRTPNPIDLHVGARIRMRRKLVGMSQELLAEHLGITFQQIQKYERGANRISASKMVEAARALQVTPAFFFEGLDFDADAGGDDAPTPADLLAGVAGGMELARAFLAAKAVDRRLLVGLAYRLSLPVALSAIAEEIEMIEDAAERIAAKDALKAVSD